MVNTGIMCVLILAVIGGPRNVAEACDAHTVSGTTYNSQREGLYIDKGTSYGSCNSKPVYWRYSSAMKKSIYLHMYTDGRWYFSDTQCSNTPAYMRSVDIDQPLPSTVNEWEEAYGSSSWYNNDRINVTCLINPGQCYSCSGSGCHNVQHSNSGERVYCDLDNGYYCWQGYTERQSNGPATYKRECRYGCPRISTSLYTCSQTCTEATCDRCCGTSLCNEESMFDLHADPKCPPDISWKSAARSPTLECVGITMLYLVTRLLYRG